MPGLLEGHPLKSASKRKKAPKPSAPPPKSPKTIKWTPLGFGKYEGKTLPQVLFKDPDWFFWTYKKGVFNKYPSHRYQADIIFAKARSIRILQHGPEPLVAEYDSYPQDKSFSGFDIVPKSQPHHKGSTKTFRLDHIDMSIPIQQKNYDKLGYRLFLNSMKFHLFDSESISMTKKRCEDFFTDPNNFHNNG